MDGDTYSAVVCEDVVDVDVSTRSDDKFILSPRMRNKSRQQQLGVKGEINLSNSMIGPIIDDETDRYYCDAILEKQK